MKKFRDELHSEPIPILFLDEWNGRMNIRGNSKRRWMVIGQRNRAGENFILVARVAGEGENIFLNREFCSNVWRVNPYTVLLEKQGKITGAVIKPAPLNTGHVQSFVRWHVKNAIDQAQIDRFEPINAREKIQRGVAPLPSRGSAREIRDLWSRISRSTFLFDDSSFHDPWRARIDRAENCVRVTAAIWINMLHAMDTREGERGIGWRCFNFNDIRWIRSIGSRSEKVVWKDVGKSMFPGEKWSLVTKNVKRTVIENENGSVFLRRHISNFCSTKNDCFFFDRDRDDSYVLYILGETTKYMQGERFS